MKLCYTCNQEKDESQFSKDKEKRDGLRSQCKVCRKDYQRARLSKIAPTANGEKYVNITNRLRKHRITYTHYRSMLTKQNNCCAICSQVLSRDHIDHCHVTGKVRGILCRACNLGLGMFKDDIETMKKAIDYLRRSQD